MATIRLIIIFYFLILSASVIAIEINATLVPNEPKCGPYTYKEIVKDNSTPPNILSKKPDSSYCTQLDNNETEAFKRVLSIISDPELADLDVALFAFEDERIIRKLCDQFNTNINFSMRLIVRRNAYKAPIDKIQECARTGVKSKLFQFSFRGNTSTEVGPFHYKIIIATYKNRPQKTLIVGSGNFAGGLKNFMDNWIFFDLENDSNFIRLHQCIFDNAFTHDPSEKLDLVANQNECINKFKFERSLIRSYFLPADSEILLSDVSKLVQNASKISIAIQSVGSNRIRGIIKAALRKKIPVRIIVDDDLYWAEKCECDRKFNTYTEYNTWLKPLMNEGASIKYVQTNHHFPGENLFHHKLIIIENTSGRSVLFGSANLTNSAFTINYENSYISSGQLADDYSEWFERNWIKVATSPTEMPVGDYHDFIEPTPK